MTRYDPGADTAVKVTNKCSEISVITLARSRLVGLAAVMQKKERKAAI